MTRRALFSKTFWLDATERAAKTLGQSAGGSIIGTAVVTGINWEIVALTTGIAVLGSYLASLGSLEVGESGTASALNLPPPQPPF